MAIYPLPQETVPWIRAGEDGADSANRGKPTTPFLQFMAQLGRITDFSFSLLWLTTAAQWLTALGISVPQTGDAILSYSTAARAGWILHNEGSISDGAGGGTTRANADTQNLFNLFYAAPFTDANAPLQTSTGAATTRAAQGTAAAAYAAHCRILIPRQFGRGIAIAGAGIGLTNRVLGAWDGAETNTFFDMPSHTHGFAGFNAITTDTSISTFDGVAVAFYNTTSNVAATNAAGGGSAFSIMNPRTYWNVYIKL